MRRRPAPGPRPALALALAVLLLAEPARSQLVSPATPCQTFSVAQGDEADAAHLKALIAELANAYAGNATIPTRILRLVDPARFVTNYVEFAQALERDFEFLRNRQLICRRGTLSIRGDLAVLESLWEKLAFLGPGLDQFRQQADVRIQFTRVPGPGETKEWKITGFLGDFFGGPPGQAVDLAVTGLRAPAAVPFNRPATIVVDIQNLGVEPSTTSAVLRGPTGTPRSVAIGVTFRAAGRRTLLALVEPQRDLNPQNNRREATVVVGADAILKVIPNPHTVSFPTDRVTVCVVDPDQAGKAQVKVLLRHQLVSGAPLAGAEASTEDREELELPASDSPQVCGEAPSATGVFAVLQLATGFFNCFGGASPQLPTPGNQRLEFPHGPECFFPGGLASGRLTVSYIDPVDAAGRANRTISASFVTRFARF